LNNQLSLFCKSHRFYGGFLFKDLTMKKPVIAIIGGGFCGTMTAINLFKYAASPIDIRIINADYPLANGIAYSAHTLKYLLNVPAENMGAFADKPLDFSNWLIENKFYKPEETEILSKTFQPRKLYGLYLKDVWQQALNTKPDYVDVSIINDIAENINPVENSYTIVLSKTENITTDVIVLATGNAAPQQLIVNKKPLDDYKNYFANPWNEACVSDVKHFKNILIIGNGLTMIDTVLGIRENGFSGTIHTISPNGFSLIPHRHVGTKYTLLQNEIEHVKNLHQLRRIIYRHIIKVRNFGLSPELVTDALRSTTVKIWQQFTNEEKKTFLKELSYQWNVVRHRTPHHIYDYLLKLREEKKFLPYTGKMKNCFEDEDGKIHVIFANKKTREDQHLIVDRIINCTGPDSKLQQSDNVLLRNLALKGFIIADIFNLGIKTNDDNYSIIDEQGRAHPNVFTLGTNLKGKLWESVAVPELRVQAEETSKQILSFLDSKQRNNKPEEKKVPDLFIGS
jgi:uncharacterized NAD(P)/FAD-binding protein YdhS